MYINTHEKMVVSCHYWEGFNMDNRKIVDGYIFSNEKEAELARKELATIKYLKEMNNMNNPKVMFQVYEKMVKQKLFVTPVGIDYLKNIRRQLLLHYKKDDILPIPVLNADDAPDVSTINIRKTMLEYNDIGNNYRHKLKISIIVNVMLALALAAMIFIVSTTKSAHILNYENIIIDRYEQWEQELNEREQKLNKQSRE